MFYSTNETLPIFLDSILGGGVLAVASSTALILLFGEVIPQGEYAFDFFLFFCLVYVRFSGLIWISNLSAICSRYGLAIGAASTPIMKVLVSLRIMIPCSTNHPEQDTDLFAAFVLHLV